MNKKGEFGWEEISKILLAIGVLVVLLLLITLFKDKSINILDFIKNAVRFGL